MSTQTVDRTGNSFCGPLVLAAIMRCTAGEAAERVRRCAGHSKPVKGTAWWELRDTLEYYGFRTEGERAALAMRYVNNRIPGETATRTDNTMDARKGGMMRHYVSGMGTRMDWSAPYTPVKRVGPTLAEWMREKRDPHAWYIVEVSHHWVLVKGRKFVDTFTKGEWVFLRSAPHRRKRVRNVWRVEI